MKKTLFFILILLAALAAFWFFNAKTTRPQTQDGKITVVASGYVPYTVAKQIGGDNINLSMLLPANAEPHSFEPTPGAIVAVHGADVFIYVSGRIEPWATDILTNTQDGAIVVEAAASAKPSKDPHVWMDFDNMRPFAQAIAQALQEKDPSHQAVYAANLAAFNRQLDELDRQFAAALKNCKRRRIVHVGHLAFGNLASRYGLELTALAGTSHDGEHSVKRLAQVVDLVKNSGAPYVFTEEALSQNLAGVVAKETGAQLLPLYTVEHVSAQDAQNNVTYADLMRRNLASLQRGLECQP